MVLAGRVDRVLVLLLGATEVDLFLLLADSGT